MKQTLHTLVNAIKVLFLLAIGATLVIGAQSIGFLPFYGEGRDLFKWLADDPRVGMWLQPGYTYIVTVLFLIFLAVVHAKLAQHLKRELTVPLSVSE